MKINNSKDKYLRQTKSCESTAPEIVALAYKLGVHKLLVLDATERDRLEWDYAENVFAWVKNNIKFNIGGGTARETLKDGRGVCDQKVGLLIALFRAGGLKARYGIKASTELDPRLQELALEIEKNMGAFGKVMSNALNAFPGHELAEVYIDKKWIQAEPTFQDELEAGLGFPIMKFGDKPDWADRDMFYLESSPTGKFISKHSRNMHGLIYLIDEGFKDSIKKGREILEMGEEAYEEKLKKGFEGLKGELDDIMKEIE